MLKVIPQHWALGSKQIWIRSFKWGTVHPCISRGWQTARCQKLWFDKKNLELAHSNADYADLLSKKVFECARKRFFIKPQLLTSGSLSAPWDTRMLNTSFERSIFFLQHKILKRWFAALLRWFMLSQSTLILLHKMAFQPFWLDLTVYSMKVSIDNILLPDY